MSLISIGLSGIAADTADLEGQKDGAMNRVGLRAPAGATCLKSILTGLNEDFHMLSSSSKFFYEILATEVGLAIKVNSVIYRPYHSNT